jgi:predicted nucleotidyltransferase
MADALAGLLAARRARRAELLDVAAAYAAALARRQGPLSAFVAGSVARGDFHPGSDIDVIVVARALPPQPLPRAALLHAVATGAIEPRGYTPPEWAALRARRVAWIEAALAEAVWLRDDLGLQEGRQR